MKCAKKIAISLVLFSLLFTQGCISVSNWGLKQDRTEIAGQLNRHESELERHVRAYVTGSVDALALSDDKSSEDIVALNLAKKAQEIVGLPKPGDKIHVIDLINKNELALENIDDRELDVIKLHRRKEVLGHDLKDTEEKLISLGELKAKEQKEGFFDGIWAWLTGTFGFIGAIVAVVLLGPAMLPILTQFIGYFVARIPGLIAWFGITSSQLTTNIIRGVNDAKQKIKSADEEKKFTKNEVLNIFGNSLGNSTNVSDKNAIDRIKRKFK
jgi:hypothetical protein